MRTVVQALNDLLDPRVIQRGPLELSEGEEGSTCPTTKLERSGQCVAVRFEPWSQSKQEVPVNTWLFPLFDRTQGTVPVCRCCDYLIFHMPAKQSERLIVFMCELKSGAPKGSMPQIRNGTLLARYILEVVKLHGGVSRWPSVDYRGLVFAGKGPNPRGSLKPSVTPKYVSDSLDGLDTMIVRPGGSYDLRSLCG